MNAIGIKPLITALDFSTAQYIFAGIITVAMIVLLVMFAVVLYKLFSKSEAAKDRERTELRYNRRTKEYEREKKELERKLQKAETAAEKQARRVERDRAEAEQMERELMASGIAQEDAKQYAAMTLSQLLLIKDSGNGSVPGDFIVNAITRSVVKDCPYEMRDDLEFRTPVAITKDFNTTALRDYMCAFEDTERSGGSRGEVFKINGKSFAMFNTRAGEKFRITVKVGNHYADKLRVAFPETISKAKFPAGLFWYSVENETECSLELAKLMVEISYNIAKAGY